MDTNQTTQIPATDLTKRPPRSVRCRLGGYALLPRMLDKGRAEIAGTNGEFHFACPLDQQILSFLQIEAGALREQLALGRGDGEILEWIKEQSKAQRTPWEVEQWSRYQEQRGPDSDAESLDFFTGMLRAISMTRPDIRTWAEMLDLDDYATFGGRP